MCRQEARPARGARRGGAIVDRLCFFTAFFPLVPPRLNMLMRMKCIIKHDHHACHHGGAFSTVLWLCTALDLQTA